MRKITVEELEIIITASVEQALKEFKKLSPEIQKATKQITEELNKVNVKDITPNIDISHVKKQLENIDMKKIKDEVKQVANTIKAEYGNAFKSTEKEQELLYEKIKQKKAQLANLKTNGISVNASDEEIRTKIKETGKMPELIDKTKILEIEAEIEKLENKLIDLQNKESLTDTSGMQIQLNAFKLASKTISGVAQNVKNYKAELGSVGDTFDRVRNSMKKTTDSTGSNLSRNTKQVDEYTRKLDKLYAQWGQNKVKTSDIRQFKANNAPSMQNQQTSVELGQNSLSIWDILRAKIQQVKPAIEQFKQALNTNNSSKELELVKYKISEIEEKLEKAKNGKIKLNTKEIIQAEAELEKLNNKKNQLERNGNSNAFSGFLSSIKKVIPGINSMQRQFNQLPKITKQISNNIKQMNTGLKGGLKNVLKYAGALFGIRSVYSLLRSSATSWLSAQNAGAKQLQANIEYMKYAMGSALAPVIQFVTNLVYQLMRAIQSVVYALTGVNIFAKASAKSYTAMAGSAKKAKEETKQLAGVHEEINNIQDNNSSDSGSGSGATTPSFDLSGIDNQLSPLAQKLYDFFKPLKESWDTYGGELIAQIKTTAIQVKGLISSVWGSLENIIVNGTVYTTLELILSIIGNIAEAFSNAWNYNGNGDAIIQNLANALNNLLGAINNVIQSDSFQDWLNNCSDKFRQISEKIANINWQPLINALTQIGTTVGTIALDILNGLVDIFKWLVENPIVAEIILGIAVGIGAIATAISIYNIAMGIYNAIMPIATAVSTAFGISIGWLIAIVVGIIAVIALVVVAIMNWDKIVKALKDTWDWIKQKTQEVWENIKTTMITIINNMKEKISEWINTVITKITDWVNTVKLKLNIMKENISNVVTTIKDKVTTAFNNIKTTISNVMTTVKNTISNIWNSIWSTIKNVVNKILGGIESFVNGTIKGINKLLSGISKVANAIGDLIGLNPISLQLSTISLPRLAKGGVLTEPTAVLAGEYSGAKSNPEIVTPQNIMRETMEDVFSDYLGNSGQPISLNLTVNVSNKKLGQILLDDLRDKTRRTGKGIDVLVGG